MWIYRSPVGILKIVRQPDGTFGLCHNETVWEACDTPQAEADNVFCHVTGCDETPLPAPASGRQAAARSARTSSTVWRRQ